MTADPTKLLLQALSGKRTRRPPFWFMRQAGRYLPEYRKLRAEAGSFLDLCYAPDLATEVTLQPIRRFGMDAAILFSDILVVPHGLGQGVDFREGEGPVLEALDPSAGPVGLDLKRLPGALDPVYQAVSQIAEALPDDVALIGFAGAPWTVASYMVEGGTSRDFAKVKAWAYRDPAGFKDLIGLLVDATVEHLALQIEAGAEVVQLFDSWAGVLPDDQFGAWCVEPVARIAEALRTRHPEVPIIAFPRAAGENYRGFAAATGVDCVSLDTTVPPAWAAEALADATALQGNLDPVALVAGGEGMRRMAQRILKHLAGRPFVFNLGHGILPHTPPEHVGALCELLRVETR